MLQGIKLPITSLLRVLSHLPTTVLWTCVAQWQEAVSRQQRTGWAYVSKYNSKPRRVYLIQVFGSTQVYTAYLMYREQQYLLPACFMQKIRVDKQRLSYIVTMYFLNILKLLYLKVSKIQNKNLKVTMNIWTREISIWAISSVLKIMPLIFLKLDVYRHYLVYRQIKI
jgi:hypothetical protein